MSSFRRALSALRSWTSLQATLKLQYGSLTTFNGVILQQLKKALPPGRDLPFSMRDARLRGKGIDSDKVPLTSLSRLHPTGERFGQKRGAYWLIPHFIGQLQSVGRTPLAMMVPIRCMKKQAKVGVCVDRRASEHCKKTWQSWLSFLAPQLAA